MRARTAHCEASRRVSVRLSACARVSYPKAAPIAIDMVKRRTHERVARTYLLTTCGCRSEREEGADQKLGAPMASAQCARHLKPAIARRVRTRAPGSPATGGAQDRPATARDQRGQHGLRRCCCDHRGARHRHHRSLRVPRMVFAAQRLRNVRCHRVHGNCVKSFRLQGRDKWMCVATMKRLLYCLGVGKLSAET